ncbi:hypothetical protein ABHI18_012663 [Aspergillus niger]
MEHRILRFNFLNGSLLVVSVDRFFFASAHSVYNHPVCGLTALAGVPRTLTHSSSVLFSVSASAVVAVGSNTSPLFSCFAAMTRGALPSMFTRDPKASFTRLRRSSGNILRRMAAEFASSSTTVSLYLTLVVVEALLFGIDGYEGLPERTTSAQEAVRIGFIGWNGSGRCEYVVDSIFDEGDVLCDRLQAV